MEWVSHGVQGPWGPEPSGAASLQAGWWVALRTLTGLAVICRYCDPCSAARWAKERSLVGREAESLASSGDPSLRWPWPGLSFPSA